MPRTESANAQIRRSQRERLMDAAREVFARKGWAATMADIATQAGVSQGLAYRYFAGKAEIMRALLEQAVRGAPLPSALDPSGTPWERLEQLMRTVLDARRERVRFYRILQHAMEDPAAPEDFKALARAQGGRFRDALRELIREGQAAGEVADGDPEELALAVLATLFGLSSMAMGGSERLSEHFPSAAVVLRMLRPCAGPERRP